MDKLSKELTDFLNSNPKVLEQLGSQILTQNKKSSNKDFVPKDVKALATPSMIRKIAMTFLKHKDNNKKALPKEINYYTIVGHFTMRLNQKENPLNQGQVSKILSAKSLPAKDIKEMLTYKKMMKLEGK
jgi:predicted nucleotidyltransferase